MAKFKLERPSWMPRWLNVPLVLVIAFVVTLAFFGDNNYLLTSKYRSQINELKSQIKNNQDSTAMYNAKINELKTDDETLEHLSREKYGMKRANEEVYITDIP